MIEVGKSVELVFTGPWEEQSGIYIVDSAVSVGSLLAMGVDVMTTVFTANTLTEEDYTNWTESGGLLYTFSSDAGLMRVPSTFVSEVSKEDIVNYQRFGFGIDLGSIPLELWEANSEGLTEALRRVFTTMVGIEPTIQEIPVNQPHGVSGEEHTASEAVRIALKDQANADSPTIDSLLSNIKHTEARLAAVTEHYEKHLSDNHPE